MAFEFDSGRWASEAPADQGARAQGGAGGMHVAELAVDFLQWVTDSFWLPLSQLGGHSPGTLYKYR